MTNAQTLIFRQGDVMIRQIGKIPESAKPVETKGPVVLALGETTGHSHAFYDGRVKYFRDDALAVGSNTTTKMIGDGPTGRAFIKVLEDANDKNLPALLRHEEHTAIPVPPGDYEIIRQSEFVGEAVRQVED